MRNLIAVAVTLSAITFSASSAQAGFGLHRATAPCPDVWYWTLSAKAYAEWVEFGLFKGSYGERHRVVRRSRGLVVVKVWRSYPPSRCA